LWEFYLLQQPSVYSQPEVVLKKKNEVHLTPFYGNKLFPKNNYTDTNSPEVANNMVQIKNEGYFIYF